eukprot:sb/3470306/
MRDILIEFERIVIPDDEIFPEKDTQNSAETGDIKLTSPQPALTTLHEKQDEIDDFDFLGDEDNVMRYLNSESKDPGISELSSMPMPQDAAMGSKNEEGEGSVRRNPVRKAKEGISYTICDDDDTDDYYCWRCKDFVPSICEMHGDLEPCPEIITASGTKDPKKFPVPSFIKIDTSKIPNAGFGIFATEFIRPGVIIGECCVYTVQIMG